MRAHLRARHGAIIFAVNNLESGTGSIERDLKMLVDGAMAIALVLEVPRDPAGNMGSYCHAHRGSPLEARDGCIVDLKLGTAIHATRSGPCRAAGGKGARSGNHD